MVLGSVMVPLPNTLARFVGNVGTILQPWISFLQQFVQQPPNFVDLIVGASPFEYNAVEPGTVAITGGTVTGVLLTRGTNTIDLGASVKLVPVAIGDIVDVTYVILPTMQFIPSYGQNTLST